MLFRVSSIVTFLFLFISLAAATGITTVTVTSPPPASTPPPASQCNTDKLYCCNNVQQSNVGLIAPLLAIIGIVVNPITALVGSSCSPLTIIGVGGSGCTAQPVCCQNNNFYSPFGVVIGCSPVSL